MNLHAFRLLNRAKFSYDICLFKVRTLAIGQTQVKPPTSFRAVVGTIPNRKIISKVIFITIKISRFVILKASQINIIGCPKL